MINMHRNLERYLDLAETDRMTGGETVGASYEVTSAPTSSSRRPRG